MSKWIISIITSLLGIIFCIVYAYTNSLECMIVGWICLATGYLSGRIQEIDEKLDKLLEDDKDAMS